MFNLKLLTPDKVLVDNIPVTEVIVPAYKGELCLLPGHSPLMSTLSTGIMRYKQEGSSETKSVVISWGYLNVTPNSIQVLAETAETPEEIDTERAKDAIQKSQDQLLSSEIGHDGIKKYQRKLKRSETRMSGADQ
ncbi:MAG: ATP synthase F1 subunit epsilon [Bdellovibrionaceae bacterium]|jgi:F-type H+-transporting ATPase subunit epsilon|nr:ATP synthase F1 subunit epsilon [Pseudobdellovibrionaceae bacterium]